jgi:RES domain-containing protein
VIVWRIARAPHLALDGEGARLYGGRWNTEGVPVVYTSQSLSLAVLEYLVHVDPELVPSDLVAAGIDLPDELALGAVVEAADFPANDWRTYPAPEWQAELGDMWVADGTFLWLAVPSAVVPEEYNVLINPRHPRMADVRTISTRPFRFDPRLVE